MPLNPPRRLAVQKKISTILAAIDSEEDDDYSTPSLADAVFRGRATFGDTDPLPMVSILEPEEVPDLVAYLGPGPRPRTGTYDLLIQGWVEDDKDNPTDPAHFLAADVTRALALEARKDGTSEMLGGLARKLELSPPVCRPPNEFSDKAHFLMRISVTLAEDLENPFA